MSKQEQNSRNKKIVNDLLKIPGNKVCAECNARGPQWASTTQGVFFCIRCAGLHRKLGTHISKVRSVGLDSWNDEQRRMVELFGNDKANAIFEAKLDREKPTADTDTATVEKFIRAKYERKLWIDKEAYSREYGNLDLNSEDSSPATTPTTPLKQSVSTQNFHHTKQNLRTVSSQDDIANPPPQKQRQTKQIQPVQQSNTPSLITFEETPKQNDLSEFLIMDNNNNQTGQRTQASSKDSVLTLFDYPNANSPLQPSRSAQPPQQQQQQQPFTIPGGPPPLNNNGMGRGMPPPMNNGMGRGMGYPPPLNNGMGMNRPPPLNNGMGMNGPPMMGRGYPPQGFNNGMMNGPPPLNNGMGMMGGPPPLNNGMGMGMNGPPPLNNGMGMNSPPMMGRGYPPQGYNPAMRF